MKGETKVRAADVFAWFCAGLFVVVAWILFFTAGDEARRVHEVLIAKEPVLGIQNGTFFKVCAGLHLGMAVFLLFGWDAVTKGAAIAWLGSTHLIYFLGLLSMGQAQPLAILRAVGVHMDWSEERVLGFWVGLIAVSLAGASALLAWEYLSNRRRLKAAYGEKWREYRERGVSDDSRSGELGNGEVKVTCPKCGQHVRASEGYAGREISCPMCKGAFTVYREPELRTECYFCKGHIRFPAHAVGKMMRCPHCGKEIRLRRESMKDEV